MKRRALYILGVFLIVGGVATSMFRPSNAPNI
jgi:hypothetical protein